MNYKIFRVVFEAVVVATLILSFVSFIAYNKGIEAGEEDLRNKMNDFGYFEFRFEEMNEETNKTETKFQKVQLESYAENWCINAVNQQGGQR